MCALVAGGYTLESTDGSPRWYLTPGAESACDIKIISDSDDVVFCSLQLVEPADGGTFEPDSFSLLAHETKTVRLTFKPTTHVPRSDRAVVSLHDDAGRELARLERQLVDGGGTDCVVTMDYRKAVVDDAQLRGFVLACSIKSRSAVPGRFPVTFTPHPALAFPALPPLVLAPGETTTLTVPVNWNRSTRDAHGLNHPHVIEFSVAVSHGRRTARLSWSTVHRSLGRLLSDAERQVSGESLPPTSGPPAGGGGFLETLTTALTTPIRSPIRSPIRTPQTLSEELPTWVAQPSRRVGDATTPAARSQQDAQGRGINILLILIAAMALVVAAVFVVRSGLLAPSAPGPAGGLRPFARNQPLPPTALGTAPAGAGATKTAPTKRTATAAPKPAVATAPSVFALAPQPIPLRSRAAATPRPAQPTGASQAVALEGVSARYGLNGRSVRISWLANGQTAALVQLTDSRSKIIASTRIRDSRQFALLYLPRAYHGALFAEVTSIGRLGERVVQTTSLPPF